MQGRTVVDDPLLHVHIPSFAIDFFAWVDDRYVRIMTLNADVELPLSLEVDGTGSLTPVFGDLTTAFANVTVTNSDLLAESPEQLAQAFPMLLGIAVGQLTGALSGISLPALAGLKINPIAITSTDPDSDGALSFLSIFANVSAAATPSRAARRHRRARLQEVRAAADARVRRRRARRDACRGGARSSTVAAPVRSSTPGRSTAAPWSAFTAATRVTVSRSAAVDAGAPPRRRARARVGAPTTTDPTPARVDVIIDTVAPTGGFDVAGHEIRFAATDAVSPPEALQFRCSVDGGAFGAWVSGDHATMPLSLDGAHVTVQVRDEAGNVGDLGFHGRSTAPSAGGCGCDRRRQRRHGDPADDPRRRLRALLVAPSLRLAAPHRHRRRRRLPGGDGARRRRLLAHSLGKGDYANPIDEIGRYHDVVFDRRHALRQRLRRHHGRSRLHRDQGSDGRTRAGR